MNRLTCFYSPNYYQGVTHLDHLGIKEYFLDTVIKPYWVFESHKKHNQFLIKDPSAVLTELDLLQVHTRVYLQSLKDGIPLDLAQSSGLRWVPKLYEAMLASVNGFYSSACTAINDSISGSFSTNFHHAKSNSGSGFCVLNGMAITAKKLISEKLASRVLIIDCDYHYGDGNAEIFQNDKNVSIFDIYGGFHSEAVKEIHAPNLTSYHVESLEEYFKRLNNLPSIIDNFQPNIILYEGGMDVWEKSRIGRIVGMNERALRHRESFVFNTSKDKRIPIAFMLGGGYVQYKDEYGKLLSQENQEQNKNELVEIHSITLEEAYKSVL